MAKYFESIGELEVNGQQQRCSPSSSSASVAARLYNNSNGTAKGSRRGSFGSEPELMSFSDNEIHSEINDISSQVTSISKKLTAMEEMHTSSGEERSRLRTENAVLVERVHVLEEQLQAAEFRWKEKLNEEKSRVRDLLGRVEREKQLEVESAALRYQVLEKDAAAQRRERDRLAEQVEQLQMQNDRLRGDLADAGALAESLEHERIKLEREFRKFRDEAQQDIDSSSEMVEVLTRETNQLRQRQAPPPRQTSIGDQIMALEAEVERIRSECRRLTEQNEDLQAQMLQDSVERGRSLLADTPSLADELNGTNDSAQLLNALKEQEVCNQKLRAYINGILIRVIERHPEILEIRPGEAAPPSLKS